MIFTDARTRVCEARLQDSSRAVICGCVVFAAVAGLFCAGLADKQFRSCSQGYLLL
jgi:hypothetical protein